MNKKGYTLLEVTLFMAISSLLALTAFVGLGPRLRNARFTDSIRNTESGFAKEMQASQSGANFRDNSSGCGIKDVDSISVPDLNTAASEPGASGNCVINGKLSIFSKNGVEYFSIVSLRRIKNINDSECKDTGTFEKMMACYQPQIVGRPYLPAPTERQYSNNVELTDTDPITANQTGLNKGKLSYGYVSDPSTGTTYRFFYKEPGSVAGGAGFSDKWRLFGNTDSDPAETRFVCLGLANRSTKISFTTASIKPVVKFDEGCAP